MARLGCVGLLCAGVACGPGDPPQSGEGSGSADGSGTSSPETSSSGSSGDPESSSSATSPDLPDVACETTVESDLPGVAIEIDSDCVLSIAQAQAGVQTRYVVTIDEPLEGVDSGTSCWQTPRGGIHFDWSVHGQGFHHCHCDVGLCPDYTPMPTTLVAGETETAFEWVAFTWGGPSDYDVPYGDPFPPGEYTIEVTASGFYTDADGNAMTPFTIVATRPVVLVP